MACAKRACRSEGLSTCASGTAPTSRRVAQVSAFRPFADGAELMPKHPSLDPNCQQPLRAKSASDKIAIGLLDARCSREPTDSACRLTHFQGEFRLPLS